MSECGSGLPDEKKYVYKSTVRNTYGLTPKMVEELGDPHLVGHQVRQLEQTRSGQHRTLFQRFQRQPGAGRLPRGRPLAAAGVTKQLRQGIENGHHKSPH